MKNLRVKTVVVVIHVIIRAHHVRTQKHLQAVEENAKKIEQPEEEK